jgi:excisionase family DNA binding protein
MEVFNMTDTNDEMVFLGTKEVAAILGCSLPTVRRIMQRRDFPLIRVGKNMKVSKAALIKWSETRRI